MSEIDLILSDEFVQYSQLIATLHSQKKTLKEEFKKQYEKFQTDIAELDRQALEATKKYETWKASQGQTTEPPAIKKGKE